MFKSGDFVADYLQPHDGGELDDEQVQPNGVDLTIDKIYRLRGTAVMGDDDYKKCERNEAWKVKTEHLGIHARGIIDSEWSYILPPGGYIVVYNEEIVEIPEDHVGFVWPRSRFLRNSAHLTSAVWDTGYSGRGEGALMAMNDMYVGADMRVGQMTFSRATSHGKYDGQHQGERVNRDSDES